MVIEGRFNWGGIVWENEDVHVANIRGSSPHCWSTKSPATALVKGLKVHIRHKHYKSHSFSSRFLMWWREQKQSPLEQLQFQVTTRHRSNKKKNKRRKVSNEKRNRGTGIGYFTHKTNRTSKWTVSLNAQHWVLFTVELTVCVSLYSTRITYNKEISFILFLLQFPGLILPKSSIC